MKVTIDRFEDNYAVVELEDRTMLSMPISLVPEGAKEGDVISIEIDNQETERRKGRIKSLMDELWE
jgi:hypothetical protein